MNEGWYQDQYFILFTPGEAAAATERYSIESMLPAFAVVGMRGWDDFILRDAFGTLFTAPTVPLLKDHLEPIGSLPSAEVLESDPAMEGRIKWYVKPLVFGGSAEVGDNLIWVNHHQHGELVRWWNAKYREVRALGG
jgi:hypothetical protein